MSELTLDVSKLPQSVFKTDDRLAEILQGEATFRLPPVATLGTFKAWYEAMRERVGETGTDVALRLYRGALAIGELDVTGDLTPDQTAPYLADGSPNDELNVTVQEWVNGCVETYLAEQIPTRPWAEVLLDAATNTLTGPTVGVEALVGEFPALAAFTGAVLFPPQLTARGKRGWERGLKLLENCEAGHVDNTLFLRQYRAALQLVDKLKVAPVGINSDGTRHVEPQEPYAEAVWRDPERVPLVLASFLVRAGDGYLTARTDPKKLRGTFGSITA
jgi:hypothetical protein